MDPILRGFGGEDRVLLYSVNAVAELEDRSNRNVGQFLAMIAISSLAPSFSACRWLVWTGLLHGDAQFLKVGVPSLTPLQVGEWLQAWLQQHTVSELGGLIAAGLERSGLIGERKGAAEGNAHPEAASRSLTSGSPTGSAQ